MQVAGLVGIGGGEFLVPLLLHMDLAPVVASTISGLSILFAVSSDVVNYGASGRLEPIWQYCTWLAGLGLLCALSGRVLLLDIVKQHKADVLVTLMLAMVLIGCVALALYEGFRDTTGWYKFTASQLC